MKSPRLLPLLIFLLLLGDGSLCAQGFSPEEAVVRMKVPPGFQVKLAACEPEIRQPVTMSFDDRGRLWIIQYLQYPEPAGLKPVKVDQYLRTVYDQIPAPPPRGPRGADRITILEDTRGDGRFHKVKDFVTGLNLASGMALGYGGVFVAQPPYLLFFRDRNGDGVPDGDPDVLLSGFGMQDAHAFPNSLQWGPDGWLYGAQGSTVTSNIRGIEFQQGIWRYHPRTRVFELFAEGGGNTWGLDFDRHGNALAGTNFGHSVMLHQVQGAYYVKGFAKHGELHNPYAFGYFDHVPYKGFKGGHVTCGGIIYEGGSFPALFDGVYLAANPLANAIYWHVLEPHGSSFTAHFGGDFLLGNDTWFRPVDLQTGPDGSLFVADWYDKRINHVDPVDNWDRTNGRIYKIEARGTNPVTGLALARLSSKELVALLGNRNDWYVRTARQLLAERRDPSVIPMLRDSLLASLDRHGAALHTSPTRQRGEAATPSLARRASVPTTRTRIPPLQALWALYVSGGFDEAVAETLLRHSDADVRAWTIRLLGDDKRVSPALAAHLREVARTDPSCTVRSQLACTCKRLPGKDALPIVRELLQRTEDLRDPFIPLLLWWAIENKAESDRDQLIALLDAPEAWHNPLVRQVLIERLSRRYMAAGSEIDLRTCAHLLAKAPNSADAELVILGMEKALQGRKLQRVPPPLAQQLAALWKQARPSLALTSLALRLGDEQAFAHTLRALTDRKLSSTERVTLIQVVSQLGRPDIVPVLLKALNSNGPNDVRRAALAALQAFPDPHIAQTVVDGYVRLPAELHGGAQSLLCGRLAAARLFLQAVDQGRINPKEVPLDQLRRVLLYHDPELERLVAKHWGALGPQPAGAKQARIASIKHMLALGRGDPVRGKAIFAQKCAICHTLFGEGNKVGPELTGADRRDTDFLVTSIVDPSAVIRKEYLAYVIATRNGRLLTGLMVESTPTTITLVDAKNERTMLPREEIEQITPSAQSLMPEKQLDDLDDQQTRDFFSYLQSAGPAKPSDKLLKVCLVSGSLEYKSDESLAAFQKYVEAHYPVKCSRAFRKTDDDLPGLENLDTCDVMLLFTRRLTISREQLARVQRYCRAGKPIVAVRTASHAFQNWLAFDKEILGGNYHNHYGAGPVTQVEIAPGDNHPILVGVRPFSSAGSLYKNTGLSADVRILLDGRIPGHTEPIAWTRIPNGGRVFYTSLGHSDDFKNPNFQRLLVNALFWTTNRQP
jgi:putative membrane-bound dehydrogenase-like protein